MSFKDQMESYLSLSRQKAVLEQIKLFLSDFVSTDTQRNVKKIKTAEGNLTVDVDESTIEGFICEMEERIASTVREMENM